MKIEWRTDRTLAFLKTLVPPIIFMLMTVATFVWAASADWEKVQAHTQDDAKHMTPQIHRELGEIQGKLDTIILRIPAPE